MTSALTDRAAGQDRVLFRDALVALLESAKTGVSEKQQSRIGRIERKLRQFPPPPDLLVEIERVAAALITRVPSGVRRGASRESVDASLLVLSGAAVRTMRAVAMPDARLERVLDRVERSMPKTAEIAELRRIENTLSEAEHMGRLVRRQNIQEREELAQMLEDMGEALKSAGSKGSAVTTGVDRIARALVAVPMPDELAATRRQLLAGLRDVYGETARLRSGIEVAEARAKELEAVVTRTSAELREAQQEASTDPLTRLANRGTFDRAMALGIEKARSLQSPMALALVDIDHFKKVNDEWGHAVGDAVLRALSTKIREEVRGQDTAARYGGEEFGLVLSGANARVAFSLAERIRRRVEVEPVHIRKDESATGQSFTVPITLSAGFAILQDGESAKGLLKRADQALYLAKQSGRNQVLPRI
jgi:diguanylate cyclase